MQITRDQNSPITVRHVEPGEIKVGEQTLNRNVVLTPDGNVRDWSADDIKGLVEDDFESLFTLDPEVIVLGTGWESVFPPRAVVFALARRGIGFETMTTPAACRTFNILVNEGRRAAAVLIVDEAGKAVQ